MILVTGGTGLVGSHLLYQLVTSGEEPVALKRTSSNLSNTLRTFSYYSEKANQLFNKITWIDGDILDYDSVLDAMDNITHVYHCAASVSFEASDKKTLTETNVIGTTNIVNACLEKNIVKLVHVSSIGSLGRADADGLVTEETYWNNKKSSVYSTSKYHSEMEVWRGIAEGLTAVIVNPSIILGPSDWNSGSSKLFTTMYEGLKFYSQGTNGFVDVVDVVKAMILLMNDTVSEQRFILNSENVSYKDLFYWMAESLAVKPPPYQATKFLSGVAWRVLWLKGMLTGKKSSITKETAETANQKYNYSNKKIIQQTGIKFITVKESVQNTSGLFLAKYNK